VHRSRAENIMVGQVGVDEDGRRRSAVLNPAANGHFFTRSGRGGRHPEELIEAVRQLAVLQWPHDHGWPYDVRLTLNQLHADLPSTADRATPLEVHWRPSTPAGSRTRTRFDLFDTTTDGPAIGTVVIESQAWTEPQWRRLRARPR
jgi:hypothetical protein